MELVDDDASAAWNAIHQAELGQLTPPLGVILFVVASSSREVTVKDVIIGTAPFFAIIVAFMLLLIAFPGIALWLPNLLFG